MGHIVRKWLQFGKLVMDFIKIYWIDEWMWFNLCFNSSYYLFRWETLWEISPLQVLAIRGVGPQKWQWKSGTNEINLMQWFYWDGFEIRFGDVGPHKGLLERGTNVINLAQWLCRDRFEIRVCTRPIFFFEFYYVDIIPKLLILQIFM